MKKFLKSHILLISIATVCVIVLAVCAVMNSYSARWRNRADFDTYSEDFSAIADLAYQEFVDARCGSDERLVFKIGKDDNGDYFIASVNEDDAVIIPMTDAQKKSMNNIIKAYTYDYSYPSAVMVYADRVSFHIHSGQYVIVFSRNGTEPEFAEKPGDKDNTHIKQLSDNWYEIAVDQ